MRLFSVSVLLSALLFAGVMFAQADFSADIVNAKANNPFQTKIFATRHKLRFQQQDRSGNANSIMLVDLAAMISVVLIPQQHQYVKQQRPQIPGQATAFFQPADVNNACGLWKKFGELKGQCNNLGNEVVDGRDTIKYENVSSGKTKTYIWIDTKLHFPIKWQAPGSITELHNIQEAVQAAELFEIPAGYTKRSYSKQATSK